MNNVGEKSHRLDESFENRKSSQVSSEFKLNEGMTLSKSARFYFEHITDSTWANQGQKRSGNLIVSIVLERRLLVNLYRISMQEVKNYNNRSPQGLDRYAY